MENEHEAVWVTYQTFFFPYFFKKHFLNLYTDDLFI